MSDKVDHPVAGDVVKDQSAPAASICQVSGVDVGRLTHDPADLFAVLYDELPEAPFAGREAAEWTSERTFWLEAEKIAEDFKASARIELSLIEGAVRQNDARLLFQLLVGLDKILLHAHPKYYDALLAMSPDLLKWIWTRYHATGRLNSVQVKGLLLPKLSSPGRPPGPQKKDDVFHFVRLVESARYIDFSRVDQDVDVLLPAHGEPIRVASAPMLGSLADVSLRRTPRPDMDGYRLGPVESSVEPRIRQVLQSLDESGATLAVLPEACLSDALLGEWVSVLKETAGQAIKEGSDLQWILVGTGPCAESDPPFNRSMILHRYSGKRVFQQDKNNGFTLSAAQIDSWGLTPSLGKGRAAEDITHGDRLLVRECNIGRIALAICEDLGRPYTSGSDLQKFGLTHLLVPVFSQPLRAHYWEQAAAEPHVWNVGTWVIVVNSLVVGRAQGVAGPLNSVLVVGPSSNTDEWECRHFMLDYVDPTAVKYIDLA